MLLRAGPEVHEEGKSLPLIILILRIVHQSICTAALHFVAISQTASQRRLFTIGKDYADLTMALRFLPKGRS